MKFASRRGNSRMLLGWYQANEKASNVAQSRLKQTGLGTQKIL